MDVRENATGIAVTPIETDITRIVLTGRLDTLGVDKIETHFIAAAVPTAKSVIVDLSGVDFVASMGIRMLVSVARSMRQRQARFALFGVQPLVNQVFEHVMLQDIIPIVHDEVEAIAAVSS